MSVLELSKSMNVEATPSTAWNMLGNLSKAKEWIPGIVKSDFVDNKRYCQMEDGNEIVEEFPVYSEDNYELEYIQIKTPLPVKSSTGVMKVEPRGHFATIFWKAKMEFISQEMMDNLSEMIDNSFDMALENLKNKIEEL